MFTLNRYVVCFSVTSFAEPVAFHLIIVSCTVQIGPVGEEVALDADLPKYIIRGSEEEENWRRNHPQGYKLHHSAGIATGASELHKAANIGDVEEVRRLLEEKAQLVNIRDENGWAPLHVSELWLS